MHGNDIFKFLMLLPAQFTGGIVIDCQDSADLAFYSADCLDVTDTANADVHGTGGICAGSFVKKEQAYGIYCAFRYISYDRLFVFGKEIPEPVSLCLPASAERLFSIGISAAKFTIVLFLIYENDIVSFS